VNLHFTQAEFAERIAVARQRMSEQALDGLLLFKQESMYYLSGYDTDGFVLFQALFLGLDGGLILVTRSADRVQAAYTSIIDDVRIWMDSQDENPGNDVRDMLQSQGMRGKRIGFSRAECKELIDLYDPSSGNRKQLETFMEKIAARRAQAHKAITELHSDNVFASTRAALAMFSSTTSAIPKAAVAASMSNSLPMTFCNAPSEPVVSRRIEPPAKLSGSSLPSTRSASVTAGFSPPRP
jgi:DNA-binding transcriptional MerR regulator